METDVTETDDDDFNEKSENLINEIHRLEDELEEIQKKKSDTDASQNPYEIGSTGTEEPSCRI